MAVNEPSLEGVAPWPRFIYIAIIPLVCLHRRYKSVLLFNVRVDKLSTITSNM